MAHWGKAGQRLTPEQARQRRRNGSAARALATQYDTERTEAGRRAHAAGLIRPDLITFYLNANDLFGPEVDAQCGVREPTVDLWETGRVYPTWPQLEALARLCRITPDRFTGPHPEEQGRYFICGRHGAAPTEPRITRFDPLALAAAGINPYPEPPADNSDSDTPTLF